MRNTFITGFLLLFSLTALAQHTPTLPCPNMTHPVNRATNKPPVPPSSWHTTQSAVVWVDVTVDQHGRVKDPTVIVSGGDEANASVLKAVREWTFEPAMCGLHPVEDRIHLKINLGVGKPGEAPRE